MLHPDTLEDMAALVEKVRANFLFDPECERATIGLPPWSSEQFLMAMAALEQARGFLRMADYFRMRNE